MESPDPLALRAAVARGVDRSAMAALDRLFPERCPDQGDSLEKIMFKAGARSVVRFILHLQEQEQVKTGSMSSVIAE